MNEKVLRIGKLKLKRSVEKVCEGQQNDNNVNQGQRFLCVSYSQILKTKSLIFKKINRLIFKL